MTVTLVPAAPFRGLNLRDQPDMLEAGQALDLMDVITNERPRVQKRENFGQWFAEVNPGPVRSINLFEHTDGTARTIVSEDAALRALGSGYGIGSLHGGIEHSETTFAPHATGFARYGQPNSERAYIGNGQQPIRRYEKTGFTIPTCSVVNAVTRAVTAGVTNVKAGSLAVWSGENRLVATRFGTTTGGPNGAVTSPDHVWISEPGDPERFRDDAFLRLSPGDGDQIQTVVSWRDLVFIFKRRKFFVLSTSRQDHKSNPIFDYRPVAAGVGAIGPFAACAGTDGVYFVAENGVYRTDGGEPELVSDLLTPLWTGRGAPFFSSGLMSVDQRALSLQVAWCDERLHMSYRSVQSGLAAAAKGMDRMAVLDLRTGEWVVWGFGEGLSFHALGVTRATSTDRDRLAIAYGNGIWLYDRGDLSLQEDAFGGGYTGRWLGSYDALGIEQIKRVPRMTVWGSGTVNVGLRSDFGPREWTRLVEFDTADDVWDDGTWDEPGDVWGGAARLDGRLVRRASRGARLAVDIEGQPGVEWSVSRVVQHVAGTRRPPDVKED